MYVICILECKKGRLELVFGGNFCQLHKVLPTIAFSKVQVQSTRREIELALEKESHVNVTLSQILCLLVLEWPTLTTKLRQPLKVEKDFLYFLIVVSEQSEPLPQPY